MTKGCMDCGYSYMDECEVYEDGTCKRDRVEAYIEAEASMEASMSKYIKVDDLQKYCDNQKDHTITPNEFQRMNHYEFGWHTGTPTEEGYYLIHLKKYYYKDTVGYVVAKFERNLWRIVNLGSSWNLGDDIEAWQKITPYGEG